MAFCQAGSGPRDKLGSATQQEGGARNAFRGPGSRGRDGSAGRGLGNLKRPLSQACRALRPCRTSRKGGPSSLGLLQARAWGAGGGESEHLGQGCNLPTGQALPARVSLPTHSTEAQGTEKRLAFKATHLRSEIRAQDWPTFLSCCSHPGKLARGPPRSPLLPLPRFPSLVLSGSQSNQTLGVPAGEERVGGLDQFERLRRRQPQGQGPL